MDEQMLSALLRLVQSSGGKMKITSLPLCLSMALAAILLAAPAMASGAEWTEEGAPLGEPAPIELDGTAWVVSPTAQLGGIACPVHGEATLQPGNEGTIDELEYDLGECEGSGSFAECGVTSVEETTPWSIEAQNDGTFEISDYETVTTTDIFETEASNCPVDEIFVRAPTVTAYLDNGPSFSGFDLWGGEGILEMFEVEFDVAVQGKMTVTPAETYGIEES